MQHKEAVGDIWETIAAEAEQQSVLWGGALLAPLEREPVAVFSSLGDERYALGLETIYEGYLLHYGRPRLFRGADRDSSILLGDYLYAHGLVRIADLGEVAVVADLAELISLCAQVRSEEDPVAARRDGAVWAATVTLLGSEDGRLERARASLRASGDASALARLAEEEADGEELARALALHRARVD